MPMVLTQKPDPGPASEEQGQSCGTQAALGRVLADRGLGEAGGGGGAGGNSPEVGGGGQRHTMLWPQLG